MKTYLLSSILALLCLTTSYAQKRKTKVKEGEDHTYEEYISKLTKGETDIDYQAFRFSRDERKYSKAGFDSLRKIAVELLENDKHEQGISVLKDLLNMDYTSMQIHTYLTYAYRELGDSISAKKHYTIGMGLINSILDSGDGKTCNTAWQVVNVWEEYFILNVLKLQSLGSQKLVSSENGPCDRLKARTEDGEDVDVYFGVSKVFEGYKKLLGMDK